MDNSEREITLEEAIELLPRNRGKPVARDTVIRWMRKGCRGVKLVGRKSGRLWYTTPAAIEQFRNDCTPKSVETKTRTQTLAAAEAAQEKLRQSGFYGNPKKKAGRRVDSND